MSGEIPTLYARRPSPEYAQAFDLAGNQLASAAGPALAVVSSPVHAVELLKRCAMPLALSGTGFFDPRPFASQAAGWAGDTLTPLDLNDALRTYAALLWAEPEALSAEGVPHLLARAALPGAILDVIVSSTLHKYLPAWQTLPLPASNPLLPGRVARLLRGAGWQIERTIVFHGPRATAWSLLARAAVALDRPDWSDRCMLAMRATYRDPAWLWPLAPLALIRARLG